MHFREKSRRRSVQRQREAVLKGGLLLLLLAGAVTAMVMTAGVFVR
jgi:hypothetical protein